MFAYLAPSTHTTGIDTIHAGSGTNFVLGGAMSDLITAGPDSDFVCGDSCEITFASGTTVDKWVVGAFSSINPETGGVRTRLFTDKIARACCFCGEL